MADEDSQAHIPSENVSRFFSDLQKLLASGLEQQQSLRIEVDGFQSQFKTFEKTLQDVREGQNALMNHLATCGARDGLEARNGADVEEGTVSYAARCSVLLGVVITPDTFTA